MIVFVGAVALVGASGCSKEKPLSRDEYSKQAQAICDEQIQAIIKLGPVDPGDPEAAAGAVERLADLQAKALDQLRDLNSPQDISDDVDAWIESVTETLAQQQKLADAIREGNRDAATAANQYVAEAGAKADAGAKDLGLTQCGPDATADVPGSSTTAPSGTTDSTGSTESTSSTSLRTLVP